MFITLKSFLFSFSVNSPNTGPRKPLSAFWHYRLGFCTVEFHTNGIIWTHRVCKEENTGGIPTVDYRKKMRFIFSMIEFRLDDLKYTDYK